LRIFSDRSLEGLVDYIAFALFAIHVASSLLFFFVFRRYARERGVNLHWALGAALLAYPGLAAYTTLPLTDTFCADLVMAAFAAAAWTAGSGGARWLAAAGGGLLLGFAGLCRPSLDTAALAALVAWPLAILALPLSSGAEWARTVRSRLALPQFRVAIAFALGFAACTVPAEWHCSERFGSRCLMQRDADELLRSLSIGSYSPRMYWSERADETDMGCGPGCRVLVDETLATT